VSPRESALTRVQSLSDGELDFLQSFIHSNGNRWKRNLSDRWAYSSTNSPESQSIRNRIGPSGMLSMTSTLINNEWQLRRRLKAREATPK